MSRMAAKVTNSFREKMLRGEVASTMTIRMVKSNEIVMMAKAAGFDGLMIDTEHSSLDVETTGQLCIAALGIGIAPIVRVPRNDQSLIAKVLDGGALGVIVPHVRTVEEVKSIVAAAKFPPVGKRSDAGSLPHFQYRPLPAKEFMPAMNEATMVIPMIETLEALEIVDEIAAAPGVDALFLGGSDMTAEMGIPGQHDDKRFTEALDKIITASKKAGVLVGLGGLQARHDIIERACLQGANWLSSGTDAALLFGSIAQKGKQVQELSSRVAHQKTASTS